MFIKVFLSIFVLYFLPQSVVFSQDKNKVIISAEDKKKSILRAIVDETNKNKMPKYIKFLDILPKAIEVDESLKNAMLNYDASIDDAKASRSVIYPDATLTLIGQEQDDVKPDAANDNYTQRELKFEVKQSLYDFGENKADIATSDLQSKQKFLAINGARNAAILGAAQSYIGLKGAYSQLKIAIQSEARLKKQTGLQDYRVRRGAAVASDVLQAKNALAGAVAGRVMAQGNYELAINDFETKFDFVPDSPDLLLSINIPNMLIPKSRKDFKNAVFKNGDQFKQAKIAHEIAQIAAKKAFAENFLPSLDLTGTAHFKDNNAGTRGGKTEYIAKVELTYPIELFGTQINKYNSSISTGKAASITFRQAKRGVDNSVNSSWINYVNTKMNQSNVINQVEISRQFLKNAQMAVKKGRGQMNLIVNAQNAYVNAQKSLERTNTNFAVQVYTMLSQMGSLSVKKLQDAEKAEIDIRKEQINQRNKKIREFKENLKKKKVN